MNGETSFLSPVQRQLGLSDGWQDLPLRDFTVTALDFETLADGRPMEIGVCQIELATARVAASFFSPLNGENGCLVAYYPQLRPLLASRIVVAHNRATEKRCLNIGLISPPALYWLDLLNISRALLPVVNNHRQSSVAEVLGVVEKVNALVPHAGPHNALWDATACALSLAEMLRISRYHDLTVRQAAELRPSDGTRPKAVPWSLEDAENS